MWKSDYTYQKQVVRSTCHQLPAKSVGMCSVYIIHHCDSMYSGGSEIERPRSNVMVIIIRREDILAVNFDYMYFCVDLLSMQ